MLMSFEAYMLVVVALVVVPLVTVRERSVEEAVMRKPRVVVGAR